MLTGDNCEKIYYDPDDPDAELPDPYDYINHPDCVPNVCTDEEALEFKNIIYGDIDEIEGCEIDVTFPTVDSPKAPKSKKMKKIKSMKMKKAKNMKEPKSSKAPSSMMVLPLRLMCIFGVFN